MRGAILEKGERCYTHLKGIFDGINNVQRGYNWLITDCECCTINADYSKRIFQYGTYGWLSGEELTDMVNKEDFQWVWGVLSAFNKEISLEEILKYSLPYADGYKGFWENPISIQHPLAHMELVPWDSSCTIIICKDDRITESFMKSYPFSRDLVMYNYNHGQFDESEELENWLQSKKS
ncbi:hypothetical protein acsn021_18120 [Anaerocolumna cellulosilytica]|uniref:Uncharacterized protein n=1 Tax=Anaerocolumna cellulosilytica TaxID=433286 RepID=A0A6S6QSD0_9FIRM|nr:hypothetical protein [Anaerocolumna cellulosilytica]MBB5194794.1 hypothetical protein [Anaerocolumna cellulosilytica]BCJ94243.1 hypothetical protein acsn021_18120 [Anaerocolumna cellulosilytica]